MRILLTGANGYIGKRLLPELARQGHQVICCVRDRNRFNYPSYLEENIEILEIDFLSSRFHEIEIPKFDAAYYLIHSMASAIGDFEQLEARSATNFLEMAQKAGCRQIIYLSGISNEKKLSKHLRSRNNVETILGRGKVPLTVLRAGIIVGSGSASFEIIRDLVEKLPVMITPKWLNTLSQPLAVRDVVRFLTSVLMREECFNDTFDIGGPEVLTYKQMLIQYAEVRRLKRFIWTLPVMTPRLSSYWLYFITSTSYKLAVNLVNSMKVNIVCRDKRLEEILGIQPISYKEAVSNAFDRIEQNSVVSSWKDSYVSNEDMLNLNEHIEIPRFGCLSDSRKVPISDRGRVVDNIWSIGGERGWYYGNFLWRIRGFIDKLFGGVGLRRGRTNQNAIHSGDALDFWRVLAADREAGRLLLYAEMKLPGEAWLEFRITEKDGRNHLEQTATFRPSGLFGRMYWWALFPAHIFIFSGMAKGIADYGKNNQQKK